MTKQFYEKVLPSQGVYCIAGIRNDRVLHQFAETLDGLMSTIQTFTEDSYNVFIALSTFNGHTRRAENAMFCKSLFVDLDVGESEKKYATKDEAISALGAFVTDTGLPPPTVVDSGGGYHAYWPLDRDVPISEWKIYAQKFKTYCVSQGLKIDLAVTADAARILRCPDTLNYKTDPPKATALLTGEITEYDFDVFKEFLGVEETPSQILASIPKGLDEDMLKITEGNYEFVFADIAVKSMQGEGCHQIRHILLNPNDVQEPLWRAGLSVAVRCVDGEEAIHKMSEDYAGYTPELTIKKANETLKLDPDTGKVIRAYSCNKFNELNPGGCEGCPVRGQVVSPIRLGRQLKEVKVDQAQPIRQDEDTEEVPYYAEYLRKFASGALRPYARGENGGIYYMPPAKTDKDGKTHQDDPILITQHDLYPFKRMYSAGDGECLMMRLHLPHDAHREFLLPMKRAGAQDKMNEIMLSAGVFFEPELGKLLMKYVIKWGKYLVNADSAEQMRMQMGWTEDLNGFVIGTTEVTRAGETVKAAASPLVKGIAKLLHPEGSLEKWQAAANLLNTPTLELQAFGLMCGFGSPLMRFTSTPGAALCYTGPSGCGKTGALYACVSIWGAPRELTLLDGSSTENGFIGRYLNLKNLPLGLDEVSNAKPEALSKIVHQTAQGKTKIRMQGSVNAERELEQNASLLLFMTSNKDITDLLQNLKASPDGEMARYVQFMINRPQFLIDNPEYGEKIFDAFNFHYGHAGPIYVQHLFKVGEDYIHSKVTYWKDRFTALFGKDIGYRFHENMVAATFAGGELAKEAGLIDLDLERIFNRVVREMIEISAKKKLNNTDFKGLLNEFVNRNVAGFLVVNDGRIVTMPRQPLIGRSEIHNQMRYISKTALRKYLAEVQVSSREFEFALREANVLTYDGKKRLGTGWADGADIGPVAVYGFSNEIPEELLATDA